MAEGFGLPCPPPDPEEDDISDSSLDDDFAPFYTLITGN